MPKYVQQPKASLSVAGVSRASANSGGPSGRRGLGTVFGAKRHRKVLRDSIEGIGKADIRRLARRGGVKRISGTIYLDIRRVLQDRLKRLLYELVVVLDLSNRSLVMTRDVIFILKRVGAPIYGFHDTGNFGNK